MAKITFENKEKLIDNPNIPRKNKVTADDINEIKRVVNENEANEIANEYTESNEVGYSCNYLNNLIKDPYSVEEVKTNKVHTDGKPIYRRVFSYYKIGGVLNKDRVLNAPVTDLEGPTDFYAKIIIASEIRPFPTVSSTSTILQSRWQDNKIYFSGSDSWTMTADDRWFVATLEYTKTTN